MKSISDLWENYYVTNNLKNKNSARSLEACTSDLSKTKYLTQRTVLMYLSQIRILYAKPLFCSLALKSACYKNK